MSSILEGADIAYLREYNESEDERRLDALQDSLGSIRQATKGGKYLGDDVIQIMVEIQGFAEQLGIDPKELDYAEDKVREAQNNLESQFKEKNNHLHLLIPFYLKVHGE